MHERTQRAVARLLFVFCCAVPTALTLGCVLVTWTPWYHRRALAAIERDLGREAGLIFEIEDFRQTAPRSVQLFGVRVLEPESRREVARVREVQWARRNTEAVILLHQPELQSGQLSGVWKLFHDRFLCQPQHTSVPTIISATDLTIHSLLGSMTLRDFDAWVEAEPNSARASIQCIPAISNNDIPITISVLRERGEEVPSTEWMVDTQGTALPCSAFAEYLPQLETLGSNARFQGTCRWKRQGRNWSVDLAGSRFESISLDRLFEQHTHRLTGSATVQLERCRIEPHLRRSDIAGSLRAYDGQIGHSLLASAHRNLGFEVRLPESLSAPHQNVPYDHLAIGFNINNTQLRLNGVCGSEPGLESYPAGVVMLLNGYPLVQSSPNMLESLRVLAAMAPPHSVPVPLSKQTNWLTNVFLPPSRALPAEHASPPHIRAAGNWRGGDPIKQPR